jgi:hypothetical protein
MNRQRNRFHSDLEIILLADAACIVSKILGIRIRIQSVTHNFIRQAADLEMMTLTWKGVRGALRLLSDRASLCSLFAIEPNRVWQFSKESILEKYACRFFEELSKQWSSRLDCPWETEKGVIESVPDIELILNNPNRLCRSYSICIGPQVILNLTAAVDLRLLALWNDRLLKTGFESAGRVGPDSDPTIQKAGKPGPDASFDWVHSLDLKLPVSAESGKTNIQARTILDVYMNNQKFAEGRIVQKSGKIGIEVIALIGPEGRMEQVDTIIGSHRIPNI